jgi:hypothetical protein
MKLNARVRSFLAGDEIELSLSEISEYILKKYILGAISRSSLAMHAFRKSSYTAQYVDEQENHDIFVRIATEDLHWGETIIGKYSLGLIVNRTSGNLVVPRNCFYTVMSCGIDIIIAPISPSSALALYPPEYAGNMLEGKKMTLGYVDNEKEIENMNFQALFYEYIFNQSFIASNSKVEIIELVKVLKEHRGSFETQRKEIWS